MGQQKKKRGECNKTKEAKRANEEVEYIGTVEPEINDEVETCSTSYSSSRRSKSFG